MSFLDSLDDPSFLQSMFGDGIPSFGGDQPAAPQGGIGSDYARNPAPDAVPLPPSDPRRPMQGGGIGSDIDSRQSPVPLPPGADQQPYDPMTGIPIGAGWQPPQQANPRPSGQGGIGSDYASTLNNPDRPVSYEDAMSGHSTAPPQSVPLPLNAGRSGGIGSDFARNPTPDAVPLPPQRPTMDMSARPVQQPGQPPLPPQAAGGQPMSPAPAQPGPSAPPIPPSNGAGNVTSNGSKGGFLSNLMPSGFDGKKFTAALGAGLSTVQGGKLGAFSQGMGGALTAGVKQDNTEDDKKLKALGAAISARKAGDTEGYRKNYLDYLNASLDNKKQIAAGKTNGSWNKPAYQRYLDGQRLFTMQQKQLYNELGLQDKSLSESDRAKKVEEYGRRSKELQGTIMQGVGVNPQELADIAKNPPGTASNPHKVQGEADFKSYVQPGQYYVNPRDGKTYVRKTEKGAESSPTPQATAPLPSDPALNGGPSTDHEPDDNAA